MRKFGPPELVSDYSEFGRQQVLRDALQAKPGPSQVFTSPDRRHLFLLLPHERKLLSFLHLPAEVQLLPAPYLDKSWTANLPPVAGVLFPRCGTLSWVLALVWENGRAEVWSPPNSKPNNGWTLLQSVELCNGPRGRVASICCNGEDLVWCEERPSSEAKHLSVSRTSQFNYCICQRSLEVQGQKVTLGGMKIVLHHSPLYNVLSNSHHVFMIPCAIPSLPPILLVYSPLEDRITLSNTSIGIFHSKSLTEGDSDFKKMLSECVAIMNFETFADTYSFAVTESGDLLLIDTNGAVHLLNQSGVLRHIYTFDRSIILETEVKMQLSDKILACAFDTVLYFININTGQLVEKMVLNAAEMFLVKVLEMDGIQLLTKTGIYKIGYCGGDMEFMDDNGKFEPAVLEMVFEEACKYYQRRSLSSSILTVKTLKKEGMFQAPIMLASILYNYQKDGRLKDLKHTELLNTMNAELQSYLSLELLKSELINAAGNATEEYCKDLVDQEISRLLHADIDRENLVYMNSLFRMFPKTVWHSLRNKLQFHQNGEGKVTVRATSDMWKKVLCPLSNGSKENTPNGVNPLFELICHLLYTFKPKWLPGFVQQAQEYSGSSWNVNKKEYCESLPLYKRALSVLSKKHNIGLDRDIEIEILISSGRPQAIIQAIHILISLQQWERVISETRKFSQLSPVITKDIFITLLLEFVKHRHLDPYINELYEICPEDMTVTDILRIILQNLPKAQGDQLPFSCNGDMHLTVGSLKPLLKKVLQNQSKQEENSAFSIYPPSTPRRTSQNPNAETVIVNGVDISVDMPSFE
ncbi:BLOC-2 complex member HPS6 [Bombina bombina]|uniref:BLOC-2 complex member HPS6 n=1 Tax=Bombina bombina TaxID=8345 RepID=UPI00235AE0EB|nr:BLOC-2 complex member HPS6 [Bombina bombina]